MKNIPNNRFFITWVSSAQTCFFTWRGCETVSVCLQICHSQLNNTISDFMLILSLFVLTVLIEMFYLEWKQRFVLFTPIQKSAYIKMAGNLLSFSIKLFLNVTFTWTWRHVVWDHYACVGIWQFDKAFYKKILQHKCNNPLSLRPVWR